jgi:hypothetical protein
VRDAENATGTTGTRGRAGASARAEYERRRAKDEARRRAAFGRLAPLVRILTGPKRTTETWGRGADGEERIGLWLDDAVGRHGVVLHGPAVRARRTNLDHIVVVPSGIWVVDSKHYRGLAEALGAGPLVRAALCSTGVRWRIGSHEPSRPLRVDYAPGGTSHRPTGASPRR